MENINVMEMIKQELGLSGILMAIAILFLTKELVFTKKQVKEYKSDNAELVNKLHGMGVEMTVAITTSNNTVEKLYHLVIKFLMGDKSKENTTGDNQDEENVSGS